MTPIDSSIEVPGGGPPPWALTWLAVNWTPASTITHAFVCWVVEDEATGKNGPGKPFVSAWAVEVVVTFSGPKAWRSIASAASITVPLAMWMIALVYAFAVA